MNLPTAFPLERVAVQRPWGGRRAVRHFGWDNNGRLNGAGDAPDAPVGEWWLASCRKGSVTPLAGSRPPLGLDEWLAREGSGFGLPAADAFPLLAKFLDCEQLLSLQVHPDDVVAQASGLPCGKTEAWHVLAAEPDACVWLGTAPGTTVAELVAAVRNGADGAALQALLQRVDVAAGDTLLVPAGSAHAIGPGLLLYEIQQNSDTTWRLHDWGRGRPVQLEDAARALRDLPRPAVVRASGAPDIWEALVDCPAFRLAHARVEQGLELAPRSGFVLLTALAGSGQLSTPDGTLPLRAGETCLLLAPARVEGRGLVALAAEGPP